MHTRTCPFCRESIHPEALVCRYCQRELADAPGSASCRSGWLVALALAAVVTAGTAMLIRGFLKERRHWLEK
ncbi:MAG: hypothetical protein AB1413_05645 [Thermodesulfobacteriota bacterium]|jgi:hypothetical protein